LRTARLCALAILAAILSLTSISAARASGDLDGLSITMDQSTYTIGAIGNVCYTVPGPGQVTITNNNASGTVTLLTRKDDGSGSCEHGPIDGPAGRYCVVILFAGDAGVGTAQTCYTVFDPSSTS
jgi:hypothetical protein